ncbi:hypothetical protein [Bacillus thuringiensis]|nr:hypothetical protein [Bacillus thuringiensis]
MKDLTIQPIKGQVDLTSVRFLLPKAKFISGIADVPDCGVP